MGGAECDTRGPRSDHQLRTLPGQPPVLGEIPSATYARRMSSSPTSSFEPHYVPYSKAPAGAPNVVVIVLDDVGFGQLGCFGSSLSTPHIDSLAMGGLRFNRFHVTSICSSTRAALMTGRNHHAVGVGATQETSFALAGYNGRLPRSAATLPRILRDSGYNTFAVGKWHLTPQAEYSAAGPFERWPLGLGFERYYGFLGAETNHWSPELVRDNSHIPTPDRTSQEGPYHLTEDLVDQAVSMVHSQKQAAPDKPFFLWFATGAAHAPHHVAPEWSNRYRGQFDAGWEELRELTFERQKKLGIIPENTTLTPRPDWVPEWSSLSDGERTLFARYMEVFAGFLSHTDAQIGRLLQSIEDLGVMDNTIVLLMSDNGTSSEGGPSGTLNEAASWLGDFASVEQALEHIDEIGGTQHTNHYPWGWAWAGNSPFHLWKRYSWLGGVRAPFIVRFPRDISDSGAVRTQFMHAVDIAPSLLGLIGLEMPTTVDGIEQQRVDGIDGHGSFIDPKAEEFRTTQYFEMHGSRSIYHQGWKATTNFVSPLFNERAFISGSHSYTSDEWSLFNLDNDFSENINEASNHPERLQELQRLWEREALADNVFPLFDPSKNYPAHPGEYPLPRQATYRPSSEPIAVSRIPNMFGGFTISARLTGTATSTGVIAALGDHQGGWVLRIENGHPVFEAVQGSHHARLTSSEPLAAGESQIEVQMDHGSLTLLLDGTPQASGTYTGLFLFPGVSTAAGGLWIGRHHGLAVVPGYESPAVFNGTLHDVTISNGTPNSTLSLATTMRIGEGAD
ncbi:MAG: Arylsulfatase [Actinomycetota bacterium]